jgi:hypothetical protein
VYICGFEPEWGWHEDTEELEPIVPFKREIGQLEPPYGQILDVSKQGCGGEAAQMLSVEQSAFLPSDHLVTNMARDFQPQGAKLGKI